MMILNKYIWTCFHVLTLGRLHSWLPIWYQPTGTRCLLLSRSYQPAHNTGIYLTFCTECTLPTYLAARASCQMNNTWTFHSHRWWFWIVESAHTWQPEVDKSKSISVHDGEEGSVDCRRDFDCVDIVNSRYIKNQGEKRWLMFQCFIFKVCGS